MGVTNFSATKQLSTESTAKTPGFASIDLTSVLATTINVATGSITVKNPTTSLWVAASEKKTGKMASIISFAKDFYNSHLTCMCFVFVMMHGLGKTNRD